MRNAKAKVATGATIVLLGGLGGLALSQGGGTPSKPVADKPVVHTKVVRRTVHVTKHAKPKHPPAAAPVEPASAGASAGGAYVAFSCRRAFTKSNSRCFGIPGSKHRRQRASYISAAPTTIKSSDPRSRCVCFAGFPHRTQIASVLVIDSASASSSGIGAKGRPM